MTQLEFIEKFVLEYPRLYVRLISYNLAFNEENLWKYGFLLSWDKIGVAGNSLINWTPLLQSKFSEKLAGNWHNPEKQDYLTLAKNEYLPEDYIPDVATRSFRKSTGEICRAIKICELETDFRKYERFIIGWDTVSYCYSKIDFTFIKEFRDKINLHAILLNPFIDWTDTRLYSLYIDKYEILLCRNVWESFVSKYVNNFTIQIHLEALNNLKKQMKIIWKSPERKKDNTFKYFLGVYVNGYFGHQIISSGYMYTEMDIASGSVIELPEKYKYPIREDCKF